MVDMDRSGNVFQKVRVWQGPTLGWQDVYVQPQIKIITPGPYNIVAGGYIVLVDVAAVVTVNLPLVEDWVKQNTVLFPDTVFERAIWIKDLGGNATDFTIFVHPNGTDTIDGLSVDFQIIEDYQLLKLYPLFDLSGWFLG